jgi:putative DNA primase/helicase
VNALFPEIAPAVALNGYRPVPIKPRTKKPPMDAWQNYKFTPTDNFAHCGTGILCGDVLGVDIDILDKDLVIEIVKWTMERFGRVPIRFGNAPKALLLYRAARPGIRKSRTAVYSRDKAKVEVLGTGQQFVAYSIHPETCRPYEWQLGSPLETRVDELPCLADDDIAMLLHYASEKLDCWAKGEASAYAATPAEHTFLTGKVSDVFAKAGITVAINDDLRRGREKPTVSLDELCVALSELASVPAIDNYDDWLAIGQAIHHEAHGSSEGLSLYIAFSKCLGGYYRGAEPGDAGCEAKWRSFGRQSGLPRTGHFITKVLRARFSSGKSD